MGLLDQFFGNADQTQALGLLGANMMAGNAPQGFLAANQHLAGAPDRRMKQQLSQMQLLEAQQKMEDAQRQRQFLQNLPQPGAGGSPLMYEAAKARAIPLSDYLKSMAPRGLEFGKIDPKDYTQESLQAAQATGDYTKLVPARKLDVVNNQAVNLYDTKPGQVFDTFDPNKPFNLQGGRLAPNTPFQQYETGKARAGASQVNVNTGQKGLDNELKIRSDFRSEPIYKAHQDVLSAHSQITQSLAQASPAGDLAGATKLMKILDPGSVVRESELGMAMAASGMLDRAQNYASMVMSGQKLTPTQRKDFKNLADKLFEESSKQYNSKRAEYSQFGTAYGLDSDRMLGPSLSVPKPQPAASAPDIDALLKKYGK